MIDLELFGSLEAEIPQTIIACMSVSSDMSKKIDVDPVLTLLESNHDFCDSKKEINVLCIERSAIITGLIRANHLLCFKY